VSECDEEKSTLFANLLATQNVPAAQLTANDAFQQLSFLLPGVHEVLELVNAGEIKRLSKRYPDEKRLNSMASLMRC
jgi:hypothetical protein